MSMVVWALTLRGRARTVIATISVACLALLAWAVGPNITKLPAAQQAASSDGPRQRW
jgi:thiol:disulfide interchange protein DsbD